MPSVQTGRSKMPARASFVSLDPAGLLAPFDSALPWHGNRLYPD
jgi:hypothetical protein